MDFISCKICQIPYDEEDHQPRNSPCGHELCTACLRALIKDCIFECPKCRQKNKVNVPEDLPVCYGLIDVIRAFKANTFSLKKEADSRVSGATNENVCSIHYKAISHWCSKCQLWNCMDCLDSHTSLTGCSAISATKAVEELKYNHNKSADQLLNKFEKDSKHITSKIQEHTKKRKEHLELAEEQGEEVKKLKNQLEQGTNHKEKLEESKKHLNETNSPLAVSDSINIVTQRKQTLLSWAAKNLGTDASLEPKQELLEVLTKRNYVCVEKVIKDEKRYSQVSQIDGNIYVHTFQKKFMDNGDSCMPFDQLEKMIPSDASQVFLELSLGGVVQGKVHIRLDKNLKNTREYIVQLVMGERGHSLNGTTLAYDGVGSLLYKHNIPLSMMTFTPDKNGNSTSKKGDILGHFYNGYLEHMFIHCSTYPNTYRDDLCKFGNIDKGIEVLQKCIDNYSKGITITDCGLVIKRG